MVLTIAAAALLLAPGYAAPKQTAHATLKLEHVTSSKALENGVTKDELIEVITHLAFYAGWPNAMTAMTQLKEIVEKAEQPG